MWAILDSGAIRKSLARRIHDAVGGVPIRLIVGDREEISPNGTPPIASLRFRDPRTLLRLFPNQEVGFCDAYVDGSVEVAGDLVGLIESAFRSRARGRLGRWYSRLASRLLERAQANSLRGSRKNIQHHYDLNGDFYKLWLDSQLVYTCAYFPSPAVTLEEAQVAKMDYVCRKLRLQPGENVIEAGCGWGSLALHMARHYGVRVRAFNISREQILFARQRAGKEGLSDRVEFIEDDYRNISGRCDAFVSVGMLEHVGADHYGEFGRVIHRSLAEDGRGFIHFIGRNYPQPLGIWLRKRIFPGAYPPTLRQVMELFEPWDLSVRDVENLRMHYAMTLEHWLRRFEKSAGRVAQLFDEKFVRTWRLYLAGSLAGFRAGTLQLFQIVFARPACRKIPWTRDHLYAAAQPAEPETKWMHATP
jgi:cyclopropane-fatty-acyl-phospholipid synthase